MDSLHVLLTSKLSMNSMDSSVCDKGNLQDKLNIKLYEKKKARRILKYDHFFIVIYDIHVGKEFSLS